jgi:hypothetical protein
VTKIHEIMEVTSTTHCYHKKESNEYRQDGDTFHEATYAVQVLGRQSGQL